MKIEDLLKGAFLEFCLVLCTCVLLFQILLCSTDIWCHGYRRISLRVLLCISHCNRFLFCTQPSSWSFKWVSTFLYAVQPFVTANSAVIWPSRYIHPYFNLKTTATSQGGPGGEFWLYWKFVLFMCLFCTRGIGWFSNRTETSVDGGARKSNNWLDQWHSGKLALEVEFSPLVLTARFPVVKWRSRSVAKSA